MTSLLNSSLFAIGPGGYIQWEDADIARTIVKGTSAEEFWVATKEILSAFGFKFKYV